MKRILTLLVLLVVAVGLAPVRAQDAQAPQGTFLGTWPYVLPPDHSFNGFVADNGLNTNLGILYRAMVELTPAYYMWAENKYEPLLAEKWGFTDDKKAYDLTLRSDAKWSNGEPVLSDDVINTYALGRIMGWSEFNYISDVQKIDDHTVRFVFKGDASYLAERLILKEYIEYRGTYADLAAKALTLVASGAASDSEEWTALRTEINEFKPTELIASGPYTYTMDDVSDAYMTLHWQPNSIFSDTAKFGDIRLWAGETEATTPLVLGEEIGHSTDVYPASTVDQFQAQGIRMITLPRGYGAALLFNHSVAPLDKVEVRQAMAYVIDREENAFLTNGIGASGTKFMAGVLDAQVEQLISADAVAKLNHYDLNPDKAAELMTTAGYTRNDAGKWVDADGKTIALEYTFPAEFADFAGAAQNAIDQLNSFGFDITPRSKPWQEAAAAIRSGDFQLSVWSWGSGSPFATRHFFGPTQRFNYVVLADGQKGINFPMEFEWEGKKIDLNAMINDVSNGLDLEAQKQKAGEVALIINTELPFIPLNVEYSVEPFNEKLIAGAPVDGDPILQNPSGSGDHFLIWYILKGLVTPTDVTKDYKG